MGFELWYETDAEETHITFYREDSFGEEQLCGFDKLNILTCIEHAEHIHNFVLVKVYFRAKDELNQTGRLTFASARVDGQDAVISIFPLLLAQKSMQQIRSTMTHELTHLVRFTKDPKSWTRFQRANTEAKKMKDNSDKFLDKIDLFMLFLLFEGEARYYQAKMRENEIGSDKYVEKLYQRAAKEIHTILKNWETYRNWMKHFEEVSRKNPQKAAAQIAILAEKLLNSLISSAYSIGEYIVITLIRAGLKEEQLWKVDEELLIDTYAIFESHRGKRQPLVSWDRPSLLQLHKFSEEAKELSTAIFTPIWKQAA